MSNDELKRLAELVRKVVKEETKPLAEKLDANVEETKSISQKLDANVEETKSISDHLAELTATINAEVIPTQELHTKYFKQILNKFKEHDQVLERDQDNIKRLDKRFKEPEARLGIQPSPELHILK